MGRSKAELASYACVDSVVSCTHSTQLYRAASDICASWGCRLANWQKILESPVLLDLCFYADSFSLKQTNPIDNPEVGQVVNTLRLYSQTMGTLKETGKESLSMDKTQQEVDIYRDTPIRYLGYTNEVGEAFRGIVHKSVVRLSYVLASGYVLADTLHKATKVYKTNNSNGRTKRTFLSTADTLLWQSFASVIVPGLTINRICATMNFIQRRKGAKNPWISTLVGLLSIPLIIHPIDYAVEEVMNVSYREWTGYHPAQEPPRDDVK